MHVDFSSPPAFWSLLRHHTGWAAVPARPLCRFVPMSGPREFRSSYCIAVQRVLTASNPWVRFASVGFRCGCNDFTGYIAWLIGHQYVYSESVATPVMPSCITPAGSFASSPPEFGLATHHICWQRLARPRCDGFRRHSSLPSSFASLPSVARALPPNALRLSHLCAPAPSRL